MQSNFYIKPDNAKLTLHYQPDRKADMEQSFEDFVYADGCTYPLAVADCYELRVGKFGPYFPVDAGEVPQRSSGD